ncbi:tyrosine-protein phosphatase, partial [Eubacteriales bacterium OttesenSCG-928-A19]|nr:tyrosine-protein phosphatase [Eubacteriales bacterium OttesenSCG-928-A19]
DVNREMADMDMATQLKKVHTAEDADRMFDTFRSLYADLPFDNDAYRQMFASLDSEDTVPMIQHCSAGKDRTGVGCALMLLSLGVDEETVMEDYLLSAIFRAHINHRYVNKMRETGLTGHALDLVARMMTVSPDLLGTTFSEIKRRYGDFDAFLEKEYGVTPERRARWQAMHTVV